MSGYTRQSLADIQDGQEVTAGPLNDEFDAIADAFDSVSGHTHDGTSGDGPKINLNGSVTGILPIANGGTGGATAAAARNALGLEIGADVQAYDADLASIAALGTSGSMMLYTTSAHTWAETAITSYGRTFVSQANSAAARSTLGLGTAATVNTGVSGGTVPLLNGSNNWSALQTFSGGAIDVYDGTGGTVGFGANDYLVFLDADNSYSFFADGIYGSSILRAGTIELNTIKLGTEIQFGSGGSNDTLIYDDATTTYTFRADGSVLNSIINAGALKLQSTTDVDLASTQHAFQIGGTSTSNIAMDDNEIQARNNGSAASLTINGNGGNVSLSSTGSTVIIGGDVIAFGSGDDTLTFDDATNIFSFVTDAGGTNSSVMAKNFRSDSTSGVSTNTDAFRINAGGGATSLINSSATVLSINKFSGSGTCVQFRLDGTSVGSVSVSGSTTTYNTSSDVRLKQDFQPINPALLDQIKVYDFEWKIDGTRGFGVVAQELEEVVPQAVYKGDEEGSMWAVDYSKLVPLLIAKVQDLEARLAALEGE